MMILIKIGLLEICRILLSVLNCTPDGGDGEDSSYSGGKGSGADISAIPLAHVVIR